MFSSDSEILDKFDRITAKLFAGRLLQMTPCSLNKIDVDTY